MIKKHIPNSITLLNAFCGCCALVCTFSEQWLWVAGFVALGLVADFLDGAVARILHVESEIGKQLDSLADVITFGAVPGAIFYQLIDNELITQYTFFNPSALPGFLVTIFACYRLAKFNIDTRQSLSFIGLPTPAATMFVIGIMLIAHFDSLGLRQMVLQPWLLYSCILGLSYLMVSELPMFSFKFEQFRWRGNEIKIIFAAISLMLIIVLREVALAFIILLYILFSVGVLFLKK